MSAKELIEGSTQPRHDLVNWAQKNLEAIAERDTTPQENGGELLLECYGELITLFKHITRIEDTSNLESHEVSIALSQLTAAVVVRLPAEEAGKIFDVAELLSKIFAEETVVEETKEEKKKSKKMAKKPYTYTYVKEMSVTILTELMEVRVKDIHSLIPFLLPIIFKNIKKTLEKSKYFHALYVVSLMKLLRSLLRKTNGNFYDPTYSSKFMRLSKSVFEEMNDKGVDYPVGFISAIVECWTFIFTEDSYVNEHTQSILETLYTKFWKNEIAVYGISNDNTRIDTSKALAEILFNYYFVRSIVTLDDVLDLYSKIFRHSHSRDVKVGCFESISHFITLNYLTDSSFLQDCKYLSIIQRLSSIFSSSNVSDKKPSTVARWLTYFKSLHGLILPHISEATKTQILLTILDFRKDESTSDLPDSFMRLSMADDSEATNQWFIILKLDLIEQLLAYLSSSFMSDDNMRNKVKNKLISMSVSDIYTIRLYSNRVLKVFLCNSPDLISGVIADSLEILSGNFAATKKSDVPFAQLHGHALIIANMIEVAERDYVPYELIMRVTVFATSFIKNHTTSTNGDLYFKGLVCWIILIGLMNYQDEQYLLTQKAQLFLFWKVLLTHSFTYRTEEELYRNLKTRTHGLTCLLTFLNNTTIDTETSTQISYLLTKCSNFNHSVTLKSNRIDDALLENENRIVQIYLQLQNYIKSDFNSSLLLLIMKNFSDPNLYIEPSSSILNSVKKIKKSSKDNDGKNEKVLEYTVDSLLRLDDDFAYGISSKIKANGVLDLTSNAPTNLSYIPGLWNLNSKYWYHLFEKDVKSPISNILSNDSLILLFSKKAYANGSLNMPKTTTSLIDFSMELFSSVFPYLNSKIQYSLIENLNLALFSKSTTRMRSVAIAANICTALFSTLSFIEANNISLEKSVGNLIVESLRKIEFNNDYYLTCLKANCIGLLTASVRRGIDEDSCVEYIEEQCNILIKSLSDNEEPFIRMLNILALASIYQRNSKFTRFETVYDIILTMVKDPHLVVHSWSLKAMGILLKEHSTMKNEQVADLFQILEDCLLSPTYGVFGASTLKYNYNVQFNSHTAIAEIVETMVENIGPNFTSLDQSTIERFRNMSVLFALTNNLTLQLTSIKIFENLATFKIENILKLETFVRLAENIIKGSLTAGIGSSYFSNIFTERNELITQSSSLTGAYQCFQFLEQLSKLEKGTVFYKSMESTCWRYLATYPNSVYVNNYFREWVRQTAMDKLWFSKLEQMYSMTNAALLKNIFVANDELLIQHGIKSISEKDIPDELEAHMKDTDDDDEDAGKSQLTDDLQWKTKEVILRLILDLCLQLQKTEELNPKSIKITNLIRLAFQATSMKINTVNKLGLSILDLILKTFADIKDSEVSSQSILQQYDAQIASALMPAFHIGSSPDVIAMAINVGAEVIYSNIITSVRTNRIAMLFVKLLQNFNDDNENITIGNSSLATKTAKRKIELAVLNSWARLTQHAISSDNKELLSFIEEYWSILIPLWIISLREYMILKYEATTYDGNAISDGVNARSSTDKAKLLLYDPVWLNMTKALSAILFYDKSIVLQNMDDDELDSFMFTLATRCLDEILQNIDNTNFKVELLLTVHSIFKCNILLRSLLSDDIFTEVIGIFNRLIATGTYEEKMTVIDLINDLIRSYRMINVTHDEFLVDIDKLYELLRLLMFIISDIFPFIKVSDMENTISKDIKVSKNERTILKKAIGVFEENINAFDDIFKVDLYACQLFVIGRVYFSKIANEAVPLFLPLLKNIVSDSRLNTEYQSLLQIFYNSVYAQFPNLNDVNRISTFLVLLTNGFDQFDSDDVSYSISHMSLLLDDDNTAPVVLQGIRKIQQKSIDSSICQKVLNHFFRDVFQKSNISANIIEPLLDIMIEFAASTKTTNPPILGDYFSLCLLFVTAHAKLLEDNNIEILDFLNKLTATDPDTFKETLTPFVESTEGNVIKNVIQEAGLSRYLHSSTDDLKLKSFE
ncbi:Laa1 protein [Maudiozyma humilis]|uniref:Laa1 protein n=1 Tax=Maudiozyma humilis TaxID=51915 RepID=A0AAV5RSY4_MAUHU|nr:Laa1 protein [Kazachstania humilis]